MDAIGFSTGALALADFRGALEMLKGTRTSAVELSALHLDELPDLLEAVDRLDLSAYRYVSVHAPTDFDAASERRVSHALRKVTSLGMPIVIHPDVITDSELWSEFGSSLLIENMDKRKGSGRSARELARVFERLPQARLCFDIAHARQFDTSMVEAFLILDQFSDRLAQIHVSELDAFSRHRRITRAGIAALREVSHLIPPNVPVIIEAPVTASEIEAEIAASLEALSRPVPLRYAA
jgi:hypothetical protein